MAPIKIYGLTISGNVIPIEFLCKNNGIEMEIVNTDLMTGAHKTPEFLKMNPMHCIPTMDDEGFTLWESKAIMRYICNKHGLEAWYPKDVQKRALCDLALDFHANTFVKLAGYKILYPAVGFAGPVTDEEKAAAEKQWTEDVWPAFEHILKRSGGPFLGGEQPNIADLAFMGYTGPLFGKCGDCVLCKTEGFKAYFEALKAKLGHYSEIMAPAEGFYK